MATVLRTAKRKTDSFMVADFVWGTQEGLE
jgi:hypothetical protein